MIPGNYEQIVERIAKSAGLSKEEVERKIEAKRAKLSGLISKEGSAQIVASELGISFEKEKMKISELLNGMKKINLVGKILKVSKVISYNKNGREGKVGRFLLADDTSNINVVLWNVNHIGLIEKGELSDGITIEISGADVRNGEMHLSSFADLKKSSLILKEVIEKPIVQKKKIEKITANENVRIRAFVVQIFGPSFFNVCPQCRKKVGETNNCEEHGVVIPKKRAVMNLVLDDGSNNIRAVLFHDQLTKIITEEELEDTDKLMKKRTQILGSEIFLEGNARKNNFSEELEIITNDISPINIDYLLKELEGIN